MGSMTALEMIVDRRMRMTRAGLVTACRVKSIGCDLSKPTWKESLIYEHIDTGEATEAFFKDSDMTAPAGVGYCLAIKK